MIKITFTKCEGLITGFECKGHSNTAEYGRDVLCAFVSSACFMVCNTVTEIIGLDADTGATDGYMRLEIRNSPDRAQDILNGLLLHMREVERDYPDNIKVIISEV